MGFGKEGGALQEGSHAPEPHLFYALGCEVTPSNSPDSVPRLAGPTAEQAYRGDSVVPVTLVHWGCTVAMAM